MKGLPSPDEHHQCSGEESGRGMGCKSRNEERITLVPPSRGITRFFMIPGRTFRTRLLQGGCLHGLSYLPHELGIPPHDFRTMTEATKITLWLADRAIRASGILDSDIPRERIGVIISQNSGEAAGALTDTIIRAYVHDILISAKRAVHFTPDQERAIEREVRSGRMAPDDTTLLGRLNCAAAGFICNRYGFRGQATLSPQPVRPRWSHCTALSR